MNAHSNATKMNHWTEPLIELSEHFKPTRTTEALRNDLNHFKNCLNHLKTHQNHLKTHQNKLTQTQPQLFIRALAAVVEVLRLPLAAVVAVAVRQPLRRRSGGRGSGGSLVDCCWVS